MKVENVAVETTASWRVLTPRIIGFMLESEKMFSRQEIVPYRCVTFVECYVR